jgi:hypothetical protein
MMQMTLWTFISAPFYDKKIICYSNGNPLTFFTHSHFGGNDQTTEQESERQ